MTNNKIFLYLIIILLLLLAIIGGSIWYLQINDYKNNIKNLYLQIGKNEQPEKNQDLAINKNDANVVESDNNTKKDDDIIYFVKDNEECPLLLNGILYPVNKTPGQICSTKYESNTNITPIVKVPENSFIFHSKSFNDGKEILFAVNTSNYYKKLEKWGDRYIYKIPDFRSEILSVVLKYNSDPDVLETQKLIYLFGNIKGNFGGRFAIVDQISDDGNFASFHAVPCWGCEASHPTTYILNLKFKDGTNIGGVENFEWLEDGNYKYKEYKRIDCNDANADDSFVYIDGTCDMDTTNLPFIYGSFNK